LSECVIYIHLCTQHAQLNRRNRGVKIIRFLHIHCKSPSLTLTFYLIKIYRDERDERDKNIQFNLKITGTQVRESIISILSCERIRRRDPLMRVYSIFDEILLSNLRYSNLVFPIPRNLCPIH